MIKPKVAIFWYRRSDLNFEIVYYINGKRAEETLVSIWLSAILGDTIIAIYTKYPKGFNLMLIQENKDEFIEQEQRDT